MGGGDNKMKATAPSTPQRSVSTLAGAGGRGFADGPANAAMFASPLGVTVDRAGNVYVSDTYNNRIRKVAPDGSVTTLAGYGATATADMTSAPKGSFADGPGALAQFSVPFMIALDAAGNLYIADMGNNRIRKITPAGIVSTVAGSGAAGFADGPADAAQFNNPRGVAVDAVGNVYVGEIGNHRVRKITPTGVVSTLAGSGAAGFADGPGPIAQFNQPMGVAVDAASNVYVADFGNHRVRKITSAGVVSTIASADQGLKDIRGMAVDSQGNVYASDTESNSILRITPQGAVTTFAGTGMAGFMDGSFDTAQFSFPLGLAADAADNLYVADSGNNRIRQIKIAT